MNATAADFNADGKLDYAALGVDGSPSISIYTNRGNATFARAVNIPVFEAYSGIAAADFDGDNDLDIATLNSSLGNLQIHFNLGANRFFAASNYAAGLVRPVSLASDDLDGDGLHDIVIRSAFSGLSLLRGLGSGRFSSPLIITEGFGYPATNNPPRSIAIRDLNSDGAPDIAYISGTEVVTLYNIYPPRLNIARIEDIIHVHWPTNFAKGAVIEYTTDLGPDTVWTQDTFPQFPIVNTRAIFDAGIAPRLFFRLRRQD